jgi:UDP-N-acetylglucosamine--N-acetylmuramyl-(pentapeptide) pyrophosphoryl-undecaprenol N-acetylglucosamine transferase
MNPLFPVIVTGGGSGGHVFPALAIADELRRGARVDVTFVGTARGLEATVVPARGYRLELLDVVPMKGRGTLGAARGAVVAARAVVSALGLVRRAKPRVVVSVGGYAAGPTGLAAAVLRVPVAVVEPNGAAGLTNRILGPLARRVYVAWGPAAKGFAPRKTRRYGVPLRRGFRPVPYEPHSPPRVLVLGGSQGALPLNERLPEALGLLERELGEPISVTHQTGIGNDQAVQAAYRRAGVSSLRVVPFLDRVAEELSRTDVVVARAGAGTVAEIAAVGRPAVLIPFPQAADDHQTTNARALEEVGGALCLPQRDASAARIAEVLASLVRDSERRVRMSRASRAFGAPDAATDIARDVCELAGIPWNPDSYLGTNGSFHMEGA